MKNENDVLPQKETSALENSDSFSLFPLEILKYISTFLDGLSLVRVARINKKYLTIFKEDVEKYLKALKFKNYALSQGLFANPNFQIEDTKSKLLRYINYSRNPSLKEIATAIVNDDIEKFSTLCQKNFNLLEQEDLLINSALFLIAVCQKRQLQQIVWNEFCKKMKLSNIKPDKTQLDLPLLCRLVSFSLYCNQIQHLSFLLRKLIVKIYEHKYTSVELRFYSLFLRYLDTAIKLRNFDAIKIIQYEYFNKTKESLLSEYHYVQVIKNIDIELIAMLMVIENKLDASLETSLSKLTLTHLVKILQETFHLVIEHNEFYFLIKLYEEMMRFLNNPSKKLVIDLSMFEKLTPSTINKMDILFRFFVHQKDKIEFHNVELFINRLLRSSCTRALKAVLNLAAIFDFKSYFEKEQASCLFNDMNTMYLKYQQTSILEVYFSFVENLKLKHSIPTFIDYFKSHLTDVALPENPAAQKSREIFLATRQHLIEKKENDENLYSPLNMLK